MNRYALLKDSINDSIFGVIVDSNGLSKFYGVSAKGLEWSKWANGINVKSENNGLPIGVVVGGYSALRNTNPNYVQALVDTVSLRNPSINKKQGISDSLIKNSSSVVPGVRDAELRAFDIDKRNEAIAFKARAFRTDSKVSSLLTQVRIEKLGFISNEGVFSSRNPIHTPEVKQAEIIDSYGRSLQRAIGLSLIRKKSVKMLAVVRKDQALAKSFGIEFKAASIGPKIGSRLSGGLRAAPAGMSFVDITGVTDADTDGIVFEGKPGLERPIIPRFMVPKDLARKLSGIVEGDAEVIEKQRRAGNTSVQFDEGKLRNIIASVGGDANMLTALTGENGIPVTTPSGRERLSVSAPSPTGIARDVARDAVIGSRVRSGQRSDLGDATPLSSGELKKLSQQELVDRLIEDRNAGLNLEEAAKKYGLKGGRVEARRLEAREMSRRDSGMRSQMNTSGAPKEYADAIEPLSVYFGYIKENPYKGYPNHPAWASINWSDENKGWELSFDSGDGVDLLITSDDPKAAAEAIDYILDATNQRFDSDAYRGSEYDGEYQNISDFGIPGFLDGAFDDVEITVLNERGMRSRTGGMRSNSENPDNQIHMTSRELNAVDDRLSNIIESGRGGFNAEEENALNDFKDSIDNAGAAMGPIVLDNDVRDTLIELFGNIANNGDDPNGDAKNLLGLLESVRDADDNEFVTDELDRLGTMHDMNFDDSAMRAPGGVRRAMRRAMANRRGRNDRGMRSRSGYDEALDSEFDYEGGGINSFEDYLNHPEFDKDFVEWLKDNPGKTKKDFIDDPDGAKEYFSLGMEAAEMNTSPESYFGTSGMRSRSGGMRLRYDGGKWDGRRPKPKDIKPGADLSGAQLSGMDLEGRDLTGVNLYQANLLGAKLRDVNLSGANLHGARIAKTDLNGANLTGADLRDTKLYGADLRYAKLSGADLLRADLRQADLRQADLRDTDLTDANLEGANLKGAILDKGWEQQVGMRSRSGMRSRTEPLFQVERYDGDLSDAQQRQLYEEASKNPRINPKDLDDGNLSDDDLMELTGMDFYNPEVNDDLAADIEDLMVERDEKRMDAQGRSSGIARDNASSVIKHWQDSVDDDPDKMGKLLSSYEGDLVAAMEDHYDDYLNGQLDTFENRRDSGMRSRNFKMSGAPKEIQDSYSEDDIKKIENALLTGGRQELRLSWDSENNGWMLDSFDADGEVFIEADAPLVSLTDGISENIADRYDPQTNDGEPPYLSNMNELLPDEEDRDDSWIKEYPVSGMRSRSGGMRSSNYTTMDDIGTTDPSSRKRREVINSRLDKEPVLNGRILRINELVSYQPGKQGHEDMSNEIANHIAKTRDAIYDAVLSGDIDTEEANDFIYQMFDTLDSPLQEVFGEDNRGRWNNRKTDAQEKFEKDFTSDAEERFKKAAATAESMGALKDRGAAGEGELFEPIGDFDPRQGKDLIDEADKYLDYELESLHDWSKENPLANSDEVYAHWSEKIKEQTKLLEDDDLNDRVDSFLRDSEVEFSNLAFENERDHLAGRADAVMRGAGMRSRSGGGPDATTNKQRIYDSVVDITGYDSEFGSDKGIREIANIVNSRWKKATPQEREDYIASIGNATDAAISLATEEGLLDDYDLSNPVDSMTPNQRLGMRSRSGMRSSTELRGRDFKRDANIRANHLGKDAKTWPRTARLHDVIYPERPYWGAEDVRRSDKIILSSPSENGGPEGKVYIAEFDDETGTLTVSWGRADSRNLQTKVYSGKTEEDFRKLLRGKEQRGYRLEGGHIPAKYSSYDIDVDWKADHEKQAKMGMRSSTATEQRPYLNIPVTGSSALRQASYNAEREELVVTYANGKTYTYKNFSNDDLDNALSGPDYVLTGTAVNQIKKNHDFREGGVHTFDPEYQDIQGPGGQIGTGKLSRLGRREKTQIPVSGSSAIEALTWDDDKKDLIVTYAGGRTYTYKDVDSYWIEDLERETGTGRIINNIKKEGYRVVDGGEHGDMPSEGLTAERANFGMRSRMTPSSGRIRAAEMEISARPQGMASRRSEGLRDPRFAVPGRDRVDPSDGELWGRLSDEEKTTVADRAVNREKMLLNEFKQRFPRWWDRASKEADKKGWDKDLMNGGNAGWMDELHRFVTRLADDPDYPEKNRVEAEKQFNDLQALYNMRSNRGAHDLLEHLNPTSRRYLFDDARRDDSKKTRISASGKEMKTPSTAPRPLGDPIDTGTPIREQVGQNEKKPLKARLDAYYKRMSDKILYTDPARQARREMRKARRQGINAGGFTTSEANPVDDAKRKIRRRKRLKEMRKNRTRDIGSISDSSTDNRIDGRLAHTDSQGSLVLGDKLTSTLATMMKNYRTESKLKKTKGGVSRNRALAVLWDGAGYNGTPHVVTPEEFKALHAAGWVPVVRGHGSGANGVRYANDWIDDPVRFITGQGGEAQGEGEYWARPTQGGGGWFSWMDGSLPAGTVGLLPPSTRRVSKAELGKIKSEHAPLAKSIKAFDAGLPSGEREKMDAEEYVTQLRDHLRASLGPIYESTMSTKMGQMTSKILESLSGSSDSKKQELLDALEFLELISTKRTSNSYAPLLGYDTIMADSGVELIHNRTAITIVGDTFTRDDAVKLAKSKA